MDDSEKGQGEMDMSGDTNYRKTQKIFLDMAVGIVGTMYQEQGITRDNFPSPIEGGEAMSYSLTAGLNILSKNILSKEGEKEVYEMIDQEFGFNNENIGPAMKELAQEDFDKDDVENFLKKPHGIFSHPEKFSAMFFRMKALALKSKNQALSQFFNRLDRLLRIYTYSRFVPLEQELTEGLLKSGKLKVLTGKGYHEKKSEKKQSLAEIINTKKRVLVEPTDSSRGGIMQQINDARYQRVVLKATRNGMVDLHILTKEFSELAQRVGQMSADLKYHSLTNGIGKDNPALANILLTRMAILTELDDLEVKQDGPSATEKVTNLRYQANDETVYPEANRQFEIGKKCLSIARNAHDIRDAEASFAKAVAIDPTSAVAQFALGITQRLLSEYDEGMNSFQKTISHAGNNQKDLVSFAYQSMAEIEYRIKGNLPQALVMIDKAIEFDEKNDVARYDKAKYLATVGLVEESLEELKKLVEKDDSFLLKMKIDPAFQSVGQKRLKQFIEEIVEKRKMSNQQAALVVVEIKKS